MIRSVFASGPMRLLSLATLLTAIGDGAFITCSVLYFTRIVGFSATQLGLAFTVAGAAGVMGGIVLGLVADRVGPRATAATALAMNGIVVTVVVFMDNYPLFLIAIAAYAILDHGAYAVRQALLPWLFAPERVIHVRAQQHATTNLGIAVGAGLGAVALALDSKGAYLSVLLLDAVSFAVGGLLLSRLRSDQPHTQVSIEETAKPRFTVLRDRTFVLLTLINMIVLFEGPMLEVVFPIWISGETSAPRWLFGVMVLLNTLMVIAFQVRVSASIVDLASASKAYRLAGVLLLATCVAMVLTTGSLVMAVVFLLLGAILQVSAELVASAGSWVIGYRLAPPEKQGQYLGFFNTGYAVAQMLGPILLVTVVIEGKPLGWILLGGVFLAAGLAAGKVVRARVVRG